MTAVNFCYWLQGYFEINGISEHNNSPSLNSNQVATIQAHLNMVFKHEIDPSQGSPEHQAELQKLHDGASKTDLEKLQERIKAIESRPMPFDRDTPIRC